MNSLHTKKWIALLAVLTLIWSCQGKKDADYKENKANRKSGLLIETDNGVVKVKLYDDTPRHRDNIIELVEDGYYDGVLFHRVINQFMVQTGDPDSKEAKKGEHLGDGGPKYTIPAEIIYPKHFHKKGALCAARTGDNVNPEKRSSGSQFYIVTGQVYNEAAMDMLEKNLNLRLTQKVFGDYAVTNKEKIKKMTLSNDTLGLRILRDSLITLAEQKVKATGQGVVFTEEQRRIYEHIGGTPHLDGNYTVFGEVVEGIEIIDALQKVQTDNFDRPLEDVHIKKIKVIKL